MADVYTKDPVPAGLENAEFVLRPIAAADAEKDHAAVMESRAYLRLWEQSAWPEDDFTVDADRDDLTGLAARHAGGRAFTFTVLSTDGEQCLGCVYLFPPGATFLARAAVTALGADRWEDLDIVAYFWTRRAQMESGMDARLLSSLRTWFAHEWAVGRVVFVTSEPFTQQVDLFRTAGLEPRFELVEPGKPAAYLAFG
ncbi:GNAT family protein [Cryocola sp. 340MFSha3.1]|uniref:GNAT family protein n=1 Tax=Cryocola sp. 340MFSha3.1 TaxID=1169145 RepID=UPI0003A2D510|nr:GNAT family protein [Cryocola sp. 340MFSha3.1]